MHPARMALIQWPKAKWRHSLRLADGMGADLADAVEGVFTAGRRVNLIDRKGRKGDALRVFIFPEALAFDLLPEDLPGFLGLLKIGVEAVQNYGPVPITAPLVLCCTHGKHDRCCAKWGFGLYKAIAAEAAERGGVDVWECTHLGGCRLSASVLTLPAMRKYGRLAPDDAAPLLQAELEGRPHLPNYRGAAHLDQVAQVAEVAALRFADALGVQAPAALELLASSDERRDFAVTVAQITVRVRCTPYQVRAYGACSDLESRKPLKPKTVWRAEVLPDVQ
ncbi:MAG: sucrase ferredoxin [Pseudomonadota bacterium]